MTLTEHAYAKVNLYLQVTHRRENGYHELDSLVVFADCADQISAERAEALTLEVSGPKAEGLTAGPENLVYRAAQWLQEQGGIKTGAHVHLEKNLPLAAGIGGGSSDAAATLRVLSRLWNLQLAPEVLLYGALALGADVPVCLAQKGCVMRAIGEELHPIAPLPPAYLVLVNPGIALSTPQVFQAKPFAFEKPRAFPEVSSFDHMIAALKTFENHLEPGALARAPSIATVLSKLSDLPGCALSRMSGSGSTCFGLFETREAAKKATELLQIDHPDWWVKSAKMIS